MVSIRTKLIGAAAISTLMGGLCGTPAYAGFDEAQTWSFNSHQQAAPAAPYANDARAEFQGDGFMTLRHTSHQYLDCMAGRGGRLSCKRM